MQFEDDPGRARPALFPVRMGQRCLDVVRRWRERPTEHAEVKFRLTERLQEEPTSAASVTFKCQDDGVSGEIKVPSKYTPQLLSLIKFVAILAAIVFIPAATAKWGGDIGPKWAMAAVIVLQIVAVLILGLVAMRRRSQ